MIWPPHKAREILGPDGPLPTNLTTPSTSDLTYMMMQQNAALQTIAMTAIAKGNQAAAPPVIINNNNNNIVNNQVQYQSQ